MACSTDNLVSFWFPCLDDNLLSHVARMLILLSHVLPVATDFRISTTVLGKPYGSVVTFHLRRKFPPLRYSLGLLLTCH